MITPIEELRRRNDAYIIDMLDNQSNHSKEHLQAATLIFEERNLADPDKQVLVKRYPEIKEDITNRILSGKDSNTIKEELRSLGMSEADSIQMVDEASKKQSAAEIVKPKATTSKVTLLTVFIITTLLGYFFGKYFL